MWMEAVCPRPVGIPPPGSPWEVALHPSPVSPVEMTPKSAHLPRFLELSRVLSVPFNIKSDRTDALLMEVRRLTGEGVTEAVTRSLQMRLDQLKHRPRPNGERILELAQEFRDRFNIPAGKPGDPELSVDRGELLYDDGLPK